jgi:biotin operon repressor
MGSVVLQMAEKTTFITIDRNITRWRWYQDANTMRVFIHLILNANIKDHGFERITVRRGQLVTSYPHLARDLGISVQNARTAIKNLKLTGEITVKRYPKYSVITILNYGYYQKSQQSKQQSSNRQPTVSQHQSNNGNNGKNIRSAPPVETEQKEEYGNYEDLW